MIGQTISHYKITAKLGAGGMGEVYLAEDLQIGRKVAVKFLSADKSSDEESRQRFIHEAHAQAMLNHPNVATFHEVGEAEGRAFIVMEYIDGKSLSDAVRADKLSLTELLGFVTQVAEGLQAAHEKGVIHRDIKPENIMVTSKGHVKITDFGLARWKGATTITKTGTRMGTVSYMSPEQAEGKKVDHRSDVFSLGVILYELVAGRPPFEGDHEAAITYSIVNETPKPLARYDANVSDTMEQIATKCLAKRREERYQSCADLVADLRLELRASEPSIASTSRVTRKGSRRGLLIAGLIAVLFVATAIVLEPWRAFFGPPPGTSGERPMLAVLPFENLGSAEHEYFADGITEEITTQVAKISALGVISRTSAIRYKDSDKGLPEIGAELGVDYVLEGTIRWDNSGAQPTVRINPQLIRVSDDTHLWTDTYDRVLEEIFAIQSDIAEKVAEALNVTLLQPERALVTTQPTDNLEAYNYYLQGLQYRDLTNEALSQAEAMYRQAIELDSNFALAFARLSMVHSTIYWWYYDHTPNRAAMAKETVARALAIAPNLPEAHAALGVYYYKVDEVNERALAELSIALKGKTNDGEILQQRGAILQRQGKFRESLRDFREAMTIDPLDPTAAVGLANTLCVLRRYDEAETYFDRAIATGPDLMRNWVSKGLHYQSGRGDTESARQCFNRSLQLGVSTVWSSMMLATIDLADGNYEDALKRMTTSEGQTVTGTGDSADYYLVKVLAYQLMRDSVRARSCADSARVVLQNVLQRDQSPWEEAMSRMQLAKAHAGLGNSEDAVREAEKAVELLPVSKDALDGSGLILDMAVVYAATGQPERAIDQLEYLLSIPNWFSAAYLKIAPDLAPLRGNPRFEALLQQEDVVF